MIDSYISPQFRIPLQIYDFHFNKEIGFEECYEIEKQIKENILKNKKTFFIDNCKFIKQIDLIYNATSEHPEDYDEDSLFVSESKLISYENNKLDIELTNYEWEVFHISENNTDVIWFFYDLLRYSLYVAYYRYLKETNCEHIFVKFVEFLSRVDFYEIEEYIQLNEYVNSLKETEHNSINEKLFIIAKRRYSELNCKYNSHYGVIE